MRAVVRQMSENISIVNVDEIIRSFSETPPNDRSEVLKMLAQGTRNAVGSYASTIAYINLSHATITQEACSSLNPDLEGYLTGKKTALGSLENGDNVDLELILKGEIIEQYSLHTSRQGIASPKVAKKYRLHSVLAYPLKPRGRLLGYLTHFSDGIEPFTDDVRKTLEVMASHATSIIENLENREQSEIYDRLLSIWNASTDDGSISNYTQGLLNQVAKEAADLLSVPTSVLWGMDANRSQLEVVAWHGHVDAEFRRRKLDPQTDASLKRLISERRAVSLSDLSRTPETHAHLAGARALGWESVISVPIFAGGRFIGLLELYTDNQRQFTSWEEKRFYTFANQAALIIQLIMDKADLLRDRITDSETKKQQERYKLMTELRTEMDKVISHGLEQWPEGSQSELDKFLYIVAQKCATATGAKACFVRIWKKATDHLELKAFHPAEMEPQIRYALQLKVSEGLSGHVAGTGEAYYCADTAKDTKYSGFYQGMGFKSAICIPIKSGDLVIGTISVASERANGFSADVRPFIEGVADIVWAAIMRVNLVGGLSRLAEDATNRSKTLRSLLEQLVELTRDLMNEPICLLWMLDKNRNGFTVAKFALPEGQQADLKHLFISNESQTITDFISRGKSYCLRDASKASKHPYRKLVEEMNWKSMMAAPLTFQGQVLGVIELYSWRKERFFTGWQRKLFETLAGQASVGLENIISRERLEKLSHTMEEMTRTRDKGQLLKLVLEGALELSGSKRGWISLIDLETGELRHVEVRDEMSGMPHLKLGEGLTGMSLHKEEPIMVDDVKEGPYRDQYVPFFKDTRSELAVPMLISKAEVRIGRQTVKSGSKPIGVLNVESPTVRAFSRADKDCLLSLSRHTAVLLDVLDSERKQAELSHIEREILTQKDWDSIIRIVLDGVTKVLGYSFVNISFVNAERSRIMTRYLKGIEPPERREEFKKLADHPLNGPNLDIQADVVRMGEIDVPEQNDPRFDPLIYKKFGHEDLIRVFIPMIISADKKDHKLVIGTVEAGYQRGYRKYIYEQDVKILKGFVDYTVRALQHRNIRIVKVIRHEIMNTINYVRNNILYLQRRIGQLPDDVLALKCDDTLTDCESLRQQVGLLEYVLGGRFQSTKRVKTYIFKDVIFKALKQSRQRILDHGFDFARVTYRDQHKVPCLYLERAKLNQVILNLLTNSIKYADSNPANFAISIHPIDAPHHYVIAFKDWGIGIEEGFEEEIFEEGVRTPEAMRKTVNGSGLGLSIARRFMRDHGGDLILANRRGPTEFQLILPKKLGA